jgi:hypothetical protein
MGEVARHRVFASIATVEDVRRFMEHHVWAVWDFMSLLKSIQRDVAPISVPWLPPPDAADARFVNEIVTAEEGDLHGARRASHFEIYLDAMQEAGADARAIRKAIAAIAGGRPLVAALDDAPPAARAFVRATIDLLDRPLWVRVSAFAIGREDVIPDMFSSLVARIVAGGVAAGGQLSTFRWYLARHIHIDGEEHGPMSAHLFERICLADETTTTESLQAAREALAARARLWDAVIASR